MTEVDLGMGAFYWLLVTGALYGFVSLRLFRRWSDSIKLRAAGNAIVAHLMEFRLYAEEPALIVRAQWDIIVANGRLLRLLAVPLLLLAIPSAAVLAIVDGFFGRAPLGIGKQSVVTAHYEGALRQVRLITPTGLELETPPVRVPSDNQISWRIRPTRALQGSLLLEVPLHRIEKTVVAGSGPRWIGTHPLERPFTGGAGNWISVQYPTAVVLGFSWLVWFSMAAGVGAFFAK